MAQELPPPPTRDFETDAQPGGESEALPEGALPEETVRIMIEEWELDPAFVEWLQQLASDVPAEAIGYFAASAGAGVLATLIGLIIPLLALTFAYLLIAGVLALLIWLPHRRVPRKLRRISGVSIWLTIIPLFGLLWNFRVASRVPASFRAFFAAHPGAAQPPPGMIGGAPLNVGGAGKALGMWYAGLNLGSWLVLLTCVLSPLSTPLGLAALVLYILFVVKLFQMSGRVAEHRNAPPAPPAPPTAPPTIAPPANP